jgi:hypothetical protein
MTRHFTTNDPEFGLQRRSSGLLFPGKVEKSSIFPNEPTGASVSEGDSRESDTSGVNQKPSSGPERIGTIVLRVLENIRKRKETTEHEAF